MAWRETTVSMAFPPPLHDTRCFSLSIEKLDYRGRPLAMDCSTMWWHLSFISLPA
jgi:hypothetical protein